MAEELTGLAAEEAADTPDESLAGTDSPITDADSELAKQLNVDRLPDDPDELKRLAAKRLVELRDFGRKSGETSKKALEQKLQNLEERYDRVMQHILAQQPTPASDAPGADASDEDVLRYYVEKFVEQKFGSKLGAVDRLAEMQAEAMVNAARSKYSDFADHEDEIASALTRFKGITLDEAYRYVTASAAEDRGRRQVEAEIEAKRGAATMSAPGSQGTSLREPDPAATTTRAYFDWAKKEAVNDLRRRGIPIPSS